MKDKKKISEMTVKEAIIVDLVTSDIGFPRVPIIFPTTARVIGAKTVKSVKKIIKDLM